MGGQSEAMGFGDDDKAALERLSHGFRGSLLRYFGRRMRDPADVEDMVQEVFVRLIRRGGTSALERENLHAYVFETASSVLKDRLRKRVTRHADAHEPFDTDRHADVDFSPEHVLLGRERLARATAVLLELPERTRVIFVLRRLEGMKYQDIAVRLGISVSAVEKHMQRAITHLTQRTGAE
ncbi:RNA polymerase sigma factor [Sphingomonas colocasiae]|uniref:RNA polymerase sigma factor n=1 Tax=Sphingomonas colocasiae TaxID=1848973 RepID=A0ABS7PKY8_9SPHN|nr:RNA polymerase sigma factor [Sphingomonas colocasiae]MBY8821908.1 RNA polymerase sigma factor [Sphingomonas colocasiae]